MLYRGDDPIQDRSPKTAPSLVSVQVLANHTLGIPATEEEIAFLKKLRFNGKRPTLLYYYRELQSLRDPLHFHVHNHSSKKRLSRGRKMSISIQYVGFISKLLSREYSFVVRGELTETIEITFEIPNRVFTSRRLSFQNAPDLCSLKFHREMAGSVDNPLKAHYRISDSELDDYHNSHLPKSAKGFTL